MAYSLIKRVSNPFYPTLDSLNESYCNCVAAQDGIFYMSIVSTDPALQTRVVSWDGETTKYTTVIPNDSSYKNIHNLCVDTGAVYAATGYATKIVFKVDSDRTGWGLVAPSTGTYATDIGDIISGLYCTGLCSGDNLEIYVVNLTTNLLDRVATLHPGTGERYLYVAAWHNGKLYTIAQDPTNYVVSGKLYEYTPGESTLALAADKYGDCFVFGELISYGGVLYGFGFGHNSPRLKYILAWDSVNKIWVNKWQNYTATEGGFEGVVVHNGKLWFVQNKNICTFNPSTNTVTVEHTFSSNISVTANRGISHGGRLYFGTTATIAVEGTGILYELYDDTPYLERSITKLFSFNNKMLLASDHLINDGLSGMRFGDKRNVLKMYNGLGSL